MQGDWRLESAPSGAGGELGITRHVGSSLRTLPLLEDRPCSPYVQARQLWSLGGSSRRGAWSCRHQEQGQGSPPPAAGTAHPAAPLLLPLCVCLASRAPSRSLCLLAVWPAGQGGSLGPPAPRWWCLLGGRVRCREEERGAVGGPGEACVEVGRRRERPLELPGQGLLARWGGVWGSLARSKGRGERGSQDRELLRAAGFAAGTGCPEGSGQECLGPLPWGWPGAQPGVGGAGGLGSAPPTPALA